MLDTPIDAALCCNYNNMYSDYLEMTSWTKCSGSLSYIIIIAN